MVSWLQSYNIYQIVASDQVIFFLYSFLELKKTQWLSEIHKQCLNLFYSIYLFIAIFVQK